MSMSTQHGGGNRKPSTKAVSGAKPKQGGDEDDSLDPAEVDSASVDSDVVDPDSVDLDSDPDSEDSDDVGAVPKASPRKSAPARKTTVAGKPRPAGSRPAGSRPVGSRPAGKKVAPVKIKQGTPWGPIVLFSVVALVALGIVGFAGWSVYQNGLGWQDRADSISGIKDYRKSDPKLVAERQHVWGPQKYDMNPPVAGNHNPNWQRCQGDVYNAQIANEHALHSMEHGAVWITYNPSLPANQVAALAKKVQGHDFMLMSPYPNLDKPISLQAWGFQLKVDNASDSRIDQFIKALKQNASLEPGTPCSTDSYVTETGVTPHDLGKDAASAAPQGG